VLHIQEKNSVIQQLRFEGSGCAISMASASLMTEMLKGKTLSETDELFSAFHQLITESEHSKTLLEKLGKLAVLGGVYEFPARVKCATLAWHTLKAALSNDISPVSTEEKI
ncbi:MAG TPA: SUF system NifU family Fe-S cluster assembly protein, partial [Gammaproteobacteria bacterium]|nr:SUF system NifU family Fe-S cluster assembly protein [Gammaproteobacteria bacterium]